MTATRTAMDYIHNDPLLFVSYRIGSLTQRVETLSNRDTTDAEELELQCYREELTALRHLQDLLSNRKGQ